MTISLSFSFVSERGVIQTCRCGYQLHFDLLGDALFASGSMDCEATLLWVGFFCGIVCWLKPKTDLRENLPVFCGVNSLEGLCTEIDRSFLSWLAIVFNATKTKKCLFAVGIDWI